MSQPSSSAPIVLVCSVPQEAEPLRRRMQDAHPVRFGGKEAVEGWLQSGPVVLLIAGMGKVNAAHGLTALLERREARGVVGFGVGGAYPGAGLDIGAVALATREVYGDEGSETPSGWISTREIGIPLVQRGAEALYNEFDLPEPRVRAARHALEAAGIPVVAGPFVTVSCCSGTLRRGQEVAARFGAACETMEGAAYAHVAALYDLPFLEVRGISNLVEDRDLSRWRLHQAAEAAARAAEVVAASYDHPRAGPNAG